MKEIERRIELENRKLALEAAKNKLKVTGLEIKTTKGIYNVKTGWVINRVEREIKEEISEINQQLEEITGLNIKKLDYLNKVGR